VDRSERRKCPRVTAILKVEYETADGLAVDYLTDLSDGGLFIRTTLPFEIGETISFTLSFPGLLDPLPLQGIVRRKQGAAGPQDQDQGVGVEFVFSDAKVKETVRGLAARFATEDAPQPVGAVPFKILLVDDNRVVLDLFAVALRSLYGDPRNQKYVPQITTALDGSQAWRLLKSEHFDLAIIDSYLPELDGTSVVRFARADPALKELPIVMISVDEKNMKLQSINAGANLFVAKPVQAKALISTLSALVRDLKPVGPKIAPPAPRSQPGPKAR
jgi:uncharacterized protein (TIGR02266 family)